jgi:hypothetical protein
MNLTALSQNLSGETASSVRSDGEAVTCGAFGGSLFGHLSATDMRLKQGRTSAIFDVALDERSVLVA